MALELFEHHALQPPVDALFGQPAVEIDHIGSHACRNVGNRPTGRRSPHAGANAIDSAGVQLEDGTRVTVVGGWDGDWDGSGAEADFLRRLRNGASDIFGVVLGPSHDAAHRTHLHVDASCASPLPVTLRAFHKLAESQHLPMKDAARRCFEEQVMRIPARLRGALSVLAGLFSTPGAPLSLPPESVCAV